MKRQALLLLSFLLLLCMLTIPKAHANNITIGNLSYSQANSTVTFDLVWFNSWRSNTTSAVNWDAAWVFIKFRDCSAPPSAQFTHGLVSTNISSHNFNVASGA